MEQGELKEGEEVMIAEDKVSNIIKNKIVARRGEKVKVKSVHHYPVILVSNGEETFSIRIEKLIKKLC